MKKTKHNTPGKKKSEPGFIKFSKLQQAYLNEVRNRQVDEFNKVIESVYEDLGIMEKILKAPPGTYKLRMQDLSGLEVHPIKPGSGKKGEKPPEDLPPLGISKEGEGKDN